MVELTTQDFIDIKQIPRGTTLFNYSSDCPHCLDAKPIMDRLSAEGRNIRMLNSADVLLSDVEAVPTLICVGTDERQIGAGNLKHFVKECERNA